MSATSPIGFAFDQSTTPDIPASYVNFGQSRIDLSAPGGDFRVQGANQSSVASVNFFCLIFDPVMAAENGGGYRWLTGTSASAPHVAGVAALLVGLNGGSMDPQQVRALIQMGRTILGSRGEMIITGMGARMRDEQWRGCSGRNARGRATCLLIPFCFCGPVRAQSGYSIAVEEAKRLGGRLRIDLLVDPATLGGRELEVAEITFAPGGPALPHLTAPPSCSTCWRESWTTP